MLIFYRIILPLVFLGALPGWLKKAIRRGGWRRDLTERFGCYHEPPDFEPCGATHIHAVSVGETMLALKLIDTWRSFAPAERFVLAVGTPTGRAVALRNAPPNVRIVYQPFDITWMVRNYLRRFEPRRIVLVEGEMWPNLMAQCAHRNIPVSLINARMSPRSARRYRKFASLVRPVFSQLALVCTQQAADNKIWHSLGVPSEKIITTGSLKFDPGTSLPQRRAEFSHILTAFGKRPVILAASTHPGEELHLAETIQIAAPHAQIVIAPRHSERAADVAQQLTTAGFSVILRSNFRPPAHRAILLIDTTGELRDWSAHADVILIGKSFLSTGGQSPAEAILARVPVIFGPHMENFQPLANDLIAANAAILARDKNEIVAAIPTALDSQTAAFLTTNALRLLNLHAGASRRIVETVLANA